MLVHCLLYSVGSQVEIQHWEKPDGSTAIPFFSSLEALQMAISTEAAFLALIAALCLN
ncbi:MAG: SseB family protein [Symbiopectobacterium sp.]